MKPKKRAILNDVLSRKPDKPLYHYTTQTGLLGIIKTRQIWAAHTQYLNDRREFLHAVDLVRQEIRRLLRSNDLKQPAGGQILENMEEALLMSPETINVCVCSFSEDSDSLSQWRAYGGSSGFAIGFSGDVLKAATEKARCFLAPCIYEPTEQRALVRAIVEEVLEECVEENISQNSRRDVEEDFILEGSGANIVGYLNRYAPILKDQFFKEEREWRIISSPIFAQRLDYREGRSLIVPYYKLPLWDGDDQRIQLDGVVVGPTRDANRSKSSVTSFLMSRYVSMQGIGGVEVRISQVPYRDW
jgi:Protein of unknown function (DUF2971)